MADTARIAFYGELRDFLHRGKSGGAGPGSPAAPGPVVIHLPVTRRASIKDAMEALGPPHTEVDAIVADGVAVDFSHLLEPGQDVAVHPVADPMDPLAPAPLRPTPLPGLRFVVDVNIGRLARSLRMLGFDTVYGNDWDDAHIARIAADERRIVLTRDRALLKRSAITHARLVRANEPFEQLVEVVRFFALSPHFHPFSRCIACNGPLSSVPKAEIMDRLLPLTKKYFDAFHHCEDCGKIYWQGSHHGHMHTLLDRVARALDR